MAVNCPNCRQPMQAKRLAQKPAGELELDICFDCQLIWFDQHESAQLAPDAVVALFELIHHHEQARQSVPLGSQLGCVRCQADLQLTHDMARRNRFVYHRCAQGHGRLIGFWHFLREKQFVRDLTLQERQQLVASVAQVKCTSCGGPVDVRQDSACSYCRAPLAVLDKEAIGKALQAHRAAMPLVAPGATSGRASTVYSSSSSNRQSSSTTSASLLDGLELLSDLFDLFD